MDRRIYTTQTCLIVIGSRFRATRQSRVSEHPSPEMASSNGAKKPMSPSEFFAKIYGEERNRATTTTNAITSSVSSPETSSSQLSANQLRAASTTWFYPTWNPEYWSSANPAFYSSLPLPPALTALSNSIHILLFRILNLQTSRRLCESKFICAPIFW